MEQLLTEAVKNDEGSTVTWVLVVWVLVREIIPMLLKKLRDGKAPYLEIIKEKVDFLYLREKQRETIHKNAMEERIKNLSDTKEN